MIHPVSFGSLKKGLPKEKEGKIEEWENVSIRITAELGRTKRPLRDVLNIKEGTILELDKSAYEPFDILANGKMIAKGQIVVLEDKLGIRITKLIEESP